ncbi:MAG: hypothetical protein B6U73_03460 [Desulfurococcales archaeon ex4484_204]|nr:MAG: hypothetical protein B6U73_03460 [Desulfurococcales archaeon ex4484_204]
MNGYVESKNPIDKALGLLLYARPDLFAGPGLTHVKSPLTFKVYEVSSDGFIANIQNVAREEGHEYVCSDREVLEFILCKEGLSTYEAVRVLRRSLGVAKIGFSGVKDSEANSCQFITMVCSTGVSIRKYAVFPVGKLRIAFLRLRERPLRRGQHLGNLFKVLIRASPHSPVSLKSFINLRRITPKLANEALPNYFGYQRFGTRRPITHIIGKHLLLGDYEEAIRYILGVPMEGELGVVREARELYERGMLATAYRRFPKSFTIERKLLRYLLKGRSSKGSVMMLAPNIIRMYIEAYQSYIFNLALSRAIIDFEGFTRLLRRCEIMPMPRPDVRAYDECSKYAVDTLKDEGIERSTELSRYLNRGIRQIYFKLIGEAVCSEVSNHACWLTFTLPVSAYATILLRELIRDGLRV